MGELKRVRVALTWKGKTQKWLSEETGIHYVTLSNLMRGRTNPTQDEKERIARALHLPVDRLFAEISPEDYYGVFYGNDAARELAKQKMRRTR